ncbi:hypothetical protein SDC9_127617 [bioreactor metagenome]|uniref:Uncharacterized protein n=1 Tax=bioreactor metagenome TaxID=1076179 RepID=A0A645CUJ8_9ZZZZ
MRTIAARVDALAIAEGPEAGVQIDPANARGLGGMVAQDRAQGVVAPGRCLAAIEQAARPGVLPAADHGLQRRLAALGHQAAQGHLVAERGRPFLRQQQRMEFVIGRIGRKRLLEIDEVAIEIDVLVRHAAKERKAVRIERMHIQHGHARRARLLEPLVIMQRKHLHAAAAQPFHAMAAAAHDQQMPGIARAVQRHVHGQFLALHARQRMAV